ncbi:MAG: potassium channel family protein [Bacteroidota bacterium]
MVPGHTLFKAEIKKLKFETDDGTRFPGTALIHFQVDGKVKPVVELMGYMEEKEIYNAIDRGEVLNLDHCYIDKFSLRDYRLTRNLGPSEKVVLKEFSARNSLFAGEASLDFSNAVFEGEEFSLDSAWISRGDTIFESARFETGKVIFHNARFPDGYFNFKNVSIDLAQVNFKNCYFGQGVKDFQYASFGNGNLFFINTDFAGGNVNFINTDFGSGDVSFKVARFGTGKVDFHFASFKDGNVSFERTEFGDGKVDFRTVEFGTGRVNFNRSVFGDGEVSFDECEMDAGKFSFKRALLGSGLFSFEEVMFEHVDVSFERTSFGLGKVSFYKSWFHTLSLSFCHLDGFVDLRVKQCHSIDLTSTIVRDIIDMNPYEYSASIQTLFIAGMRLIGRIYVDWKQNILKQMIYSQHESSHRVKAEQFRILKENFKNLGLYHDEDRAYVEFKRNESKAELEESLEKSRLNGIYQHPLYWFKLGLFDKAGLYATSPLRVLITMLTWFVVFSFVYYLLIIYSPADIIASVDDQLTILARSFYHSAITFLTIGYGDHYPFGLIRWVSSIEGFFGLFLMSYFTVAFVRKVLR